MLGERLREMCLSSPGHRQLWGDLTAPLAPVGRSLRRLRLGSSWQVQGRNVKNNRHELKLEKFILDTRWKFFPLRTGQSSSGTGCSDRLCALHPLRFQAPTEGSSEQPDLRADHAGGDPLRSHPALDCLLPPQSVLWGLLRYPELYPSTLWNRQDAQVLAILII